MKVVIVFALFLAVAFAATIHENSSALEAVENDELSNELFDIVLKILVSIRQLPKDIKDQNYSAVLEDISTLIKLVFEVYRHQ